MIRIMIVESVDLIRGALAAVLAHEKDLEVVAQLSPGDDVFAAARACRPDAVVIEVARCDPRGLTVPRRLCAELPGCQVLVLTAQRTPEALRNVLGAGLRGFLDKDTALSELVDSVRRLAAGEWVIDPVLAAATLHPDSNPLTARQRDVLRLASGGVPAAEIARQLFLSPGTVRNYLSAAIRKTGARNLVEAIKYAEQSGWF